MSTPARPHPSAPAKAPAPEVEEEEMATPTERPQRAVRLVLSIEADNLTDARASMKRCLSRFAVGAEHWDESMPGSDGVLRLVVQHDAPTGAAFQKLRELWKKTQDAARAKSGTPSSSR